MNETPKPQPPKVQAKTQAKPPVKPHLTQRPFKNPALIALRETMTRGNAHNVKIKNK